MTVELIEPYELSYFDEIDSTSDEARRKADAGANDCLWVVASSQTNGRGRRGRDWVSKQGNFFGSLYLKLESSPSHWSELSFVAAIAVREALENIATAKSDISLKWPNDILYNGKKVAGLLLESGVREDDITITGDVILGIGVNLAHAPTDLPYEGTSVFDECGLIINPLDFLPVLTKCFDKYLNVWRDEGFAPIRQIWLDKASGIGKPVTVNLIDESFEGVFNGLSQTGGAEIEINDGKIRHIVAGDIFPIN